MPDATDSSNLSSGLTNLEKEVATVQADLSADDTALSADNATIVSLKAQVNTLTAQLANANATIASLESSTSPTPPITSAPLVITTTTLPSATDGEAYSATLVATGGTAPYTWIATGLPAGLSLVGNTISGTPSVQGNISFSLTVHDSEAVPVSQSITLLLAIAPPPTTTVPFSASFYRPLPANIGLDPNSSAIVSVLLSAIAKPEGTDPSGGYNVGINLGQNGIQVFTASTTLVPLVCVKRSGYPQSLPSGFPAGIGIPVAAVAGRPLTGASNVFSGDWPLIILDPVRGIATEIWEATPDNAQGTSWHCTNAGQYAYTPSATGVGKGGSLPFANSALAASGLSYAATLLMQSDVQNGIAEHMLALALPIGSGPAQAPATWYDLGATPSGYTWASYPHEGTIYRLPANTTISSSWPVTERVIATALRDYGAICMDFAGAPQIQAQGPVGGYNSTTDYISAGMAGAQEYSVLNNIAWSTLEVVAAPSAWPNW